MKLFEIMNVSPGSLPDELEIARKELKSDPEHPDFNYTRHPKLIPVFRYLKKRYGDPIGFGRNRIGFRKGNIVIKMPRNFEGESDNLREYRIYQDYKQSPEDYGKFKYAKAKLVKIYNVPVLYMEYVEPMSRSDKNFPKWGDCIDCGQVGKDKKGNIKAYDYAQ